MLCRGREGRDIKSARVCGVYTLAIRELGNDGFAGWVHVGHGGSSCEKVTCCARVKGGPCSYSGHVDIDSFEEFSCSERIFWSGDIEIN